MSNKESIKSRVELYVQTHGSDCLLEDVATEAYGRTVTDGELEYVASVIRDCGYTFRTNVAVWGIDGEDSREGKAMYVVFLETADHYEVLLEEETPNYVMAYDRFQEIATDVDFFSGGVDCILSLNEIAEDGKGYDTIESKEFSMDEVADNAPYKVEVRDEEEDLIETITAKDEEAAYELSQELASEYKAENKAVVITSYEWKASEGEYEFLGEIEVFIDGPALSEVNPFQVSLLTSDNDQVWHFETVEAAQVKFDSLLERLNRAEGIKATLSITEVTADSPFTKTITEEIF